MENIVDNKVVNPQLAKDIDKDLLPTEERIMGNLSYTASFMGAVYL